MTPSGPLHQGVVVTLLLHLKAKLTQTICHDRTSLLCVPTTVVAAETDHGLISCQAVRYDVQQ